MINTPLIHEIDKKHLFKLHDSFQNLACKIGCSTAAASFLILGGLIVIASASLCLTLPGVNVMTDVIIPGVYPGCLAILTSAPFITYSVLHANQKHALRRELIDFTIMLLNYHQINQVGKEGAITEKKAITFIHKHFFKSEWTKEYGVRTISDLKERYPKKENAQTNEQKALLKALDEVQKKLLQKSAKRL